MRIGVPREIKMMEGRVGLIPEACRELLDQGYEVFIESGAGEAAGYADESYRELGVEICDNAARLYETAQLVVKVKEPVGPELDLLRRDHFLFCYLHLAASEPLTKRLCEIGLTAIAFETVQDDHGRLPLLAPMSDVAGRIAAQVGCHLLYRPEGGKGLLLGGIAGIERGRVTVLGAGHAGEQAVRVAAALGAQVTVFDLKPDRLEAMRRIGANVTPLYPYAQRIVRELRETDLLIGAVLVPGARAPRLVSRDMVAQMAAGSVIVDIAVDQGGCIETIRATDWSSPTYLQEGVLHFGVANMPGAVPRSSAQALSAAITPHVSRIAAGDWEQSTVLAQGVNVRRGRLMHPALRRQFAGRPWIDQALQ